MPVSLALRLFLVWRRSASFSVLAEASLKACSKRYWCSVIHSSQSSVWLVDPHRWSTGSLPKKSSRASSQKSSVGYSCMQTQVLQGTMATYVFSLKAKCIDGHAEFY